MLGLYWGYIGVILRLYWGNVRAILRLYWGYLEVILGYWGTFCGYIGVILGLYWGNIRVIFLSLALERRCASLSATAGSEAWNGCGAEAGPRFRVLGLGFRV